MNHSISTRILYSRNVYPSKMITHSFQKKKYLIGICWFMVYIVKSGPVLWTGLVVKSPWGNSIRNKYRIFSYSPRDTYILRIL